MEERRSRVTDEGVEKKCWGLDCLYSFGRTVRKIEDLVLELVEPVVELVAELEQLRRSLERSMWSLRRSFSNGN